MKNNGFWVRRLCSFLLAFSLLLPYIPVPAYAAENDENSIVIYKDGETDYTPTITKQPQSVAEEKSAGRTSSLTVEATGAGEGVLSYQWYEVGSSEDTALTDASATTNTY